jgi:hypothetical protein
MHYGLVHVLHLLCAILFIGVVFFEVVLLEGVRKHFEPEEMHRFERAIIARARRIMPWVVGLLFATGLTMAWTHRAALLAPLGSSLGLLLWLKIALAFSVLAHFVSAIRAASDGCMTSGRFMRTHLSVGAHMFVIVLLAKAMFYLRW